MTLGFFHELEPVKNPEFNVKNISRANSSQTYECKMMIKAAISKSFGKRHRLDNKDLKWNRYRQS